MLIFYSQVKNPNAESQKRFERMRIGWAKIFKRIQKEKQKAGVDYIRVNQGSNWFCVHSFTYAK